jgi:2-oxoglutarate dehydrogenase E1 component
MAELATGGFQEVIDDPKAKAAKVDTLVLCSGKIYYELTSKAAELGAENMAFVRVEQLYPIPEKQLSDVIGKYKAKNLLWVQEEPANMGAWSFMAMNLSHLGLKGICRPASSAAAEGSKKLHEKRLKNLFNEVFSYTSVKVN